MLSQPSSSFPRIKLNYLDLVIEFSLILFEALLIELLVKALFLSLLDALVAQLDHRQCLVFTRVVGILVSRHREHLVIAGGIFQGALA